MIQRRGDRLPDPSRAGPCPMPVTCSTMVSTEQPGRVAFGWSTPWLWP